MPMPIGDSNEAILLDIFGVFRTIIVNGIFQGTEAQQKTFITNVEALENGNQSSSEFVSSLVTIPTNYKVFIKSFRWSVNKAEPTKIGYTLTMFEGANVE